MPEPVRVRGRGRAIVAAYGVADAEHLVEKELTRLWPGARVTIEAISRAGGGRVVEEFEVSYRVEGTRGVEAEAGENAASAAFRELRALLAGTRFARTEWERVGPR